MRVCEDALVEDEWWWKGLRELREHASVRFGLIIVDLGSGLRRAGAFIGVVSRVSVEIWHSTEIIPLPSCSHNFTNNRRIRVLIEGGYSLYTNEEICVFNIWFANRWHGCTPQSVRALTSPDFQLWIDLLLPNTKVAPL